MSFVDNYTSGDFGGISTGPSPDFPQAGTLDAVKAGGLGGLGNVSPLGLAGAAAAGGGLLYDLFKGNQPTPAESQLGIEQANFGTTGQSLVGTGQGLQSYLEQGTLPPAIQAQLELKQNAAKAALVQGAASKGQNPTALGNSGLSQDISSLDLQTLATKGTLEEQLFQAGTGLIQQGATFLNDQANINTTLAKIQEQQEADTTQAIMSFAKALGAVVAA